MNQEALATLRRLLQQQTIAALGTLHRGEPYVSMVPYAVDEATSRFFIHVSALAAHTRDMAEHPRVSLLIIAPEDGRPPQARARATVQGEAAAVAADSPAYAAAKSLYLARFAQSSEIFALADFSLFAIRPLSVRFIGGFAQAISLTADAFTQALRGQA
jgi:putative heme iron utilization protein